MDKLVSGRVLWAMVLLLAAQGPAFADALKGKVSPADILAATDASDWLKLDQDNLLYIELERGRVVVALSTSLAQRHVVQVKTLVREGFYDGLSFYRVIDGFVAQGGDPFEKREIKTAAKSMGAEFDEPLPKSPVQFDAWADHDGYADRVGFIKSLPTGIDAANRNVWHLHCPGAFAFGRGNARDTASTEFYITLQSQRYLDRNLTVFGRVVEGMEHLQALRRVLPPQSEEDDIGETILSMRIGADLPEHKQAKLEILDSRSPTFAAYAASRRNRPEAFFYHRPDYIDICQFAVPMREASDAE